MVNLTPSSDYTIFFCSDHYSDFRVFLYPRVPVSTEEVLEISRGKNKNCKRMMAAKVVRVTPAVVVLLH